MKYTVGQVIYLLDEERTAILPARVVEKVTKTSISGEETFFFVEVPNSENRLNLAEFEGKIFSDTKTVKSHLFENLKKNIDSIVSVAENSALQAWGESEKKPARNRSTKKNKQKPRTYTGSSLKKAPTHFFSFPFPFVTRRLDGPARAPLSPPVFSGEPRRNTS